MTTILVNQIIFTGRSFRNSNGNHFNIVKKKFKYLTFNVLFYHILFVKKDIFLGQDIRGFRVKIQNFKKYSCRTLHIRELT